MNGKVVSVNISEKKGTIKTPIEVGKFIEDFGLENDAHSGTGIRQVSLLAVESIEFMNNNGGNGLKAGDFAENITTEGIIVHKLPVGTKLRIGETIQEVTQIGKQCHVGCEISKSVGNCIMPKEGIFTRILQAGNIKAGDSIEVINEI